MEIELWYLRVGTAIEIIGAVQSPVDDRSQHCRCVPDIGAHRLVGAHHLVGAHRLIGSANTRNLSEIIYLDEVGMRIVCALLRLLGIRVAQVVL